MPVDPRGRWFRVYPRQVRQHNKFRDLSAVELGVWLAMRSECELRDSFVLADRAEALLILRRRRTPKPKEMLDTMLGLHLFDELDDGSIAVHDRDDHDRAPSERPESVRERVARHRGKGTDDDGGYDGGNGHRPVTSPLPNEDVTPRARDSQQSQPTDTASSQQQAEGEASLPERDDPVTEACRLLPSGGRMLGDADYRAAWDDLSRRFTSKWVMEALLPAYQKLLDEGKGVRPWDLKRMVEWILAERVRTEELAASRRQQRRNGHADRAHAETIEQLTPEQRIQVAFQKRAISIGLSMKVEVPTDVAEVRDFVMKHDPEFTVEGANA